jgi:hypothetical protein
MLFSNLQPKEFLLLAIAVVVVLFLWALAEIGGLFGKFAAASQKVSNNTSRAAQRRKRQLKKIRSCARQGRLMQLALEGEPEVSLAAVRRMEDVDMLLAVRRKAEGDVRREAGLVLIRRIADRGILRDFEKSAEPEMRQAAARRLCVLDGHDWQGGACARCGETREVRGEKDICMRSAPEKEEEHVWMVVRTEKFRGPNCEKCGGQLPGGVEDMQICTCPGLEFCSGADEHITERCIHCGAMRERDN